MELNNGDNILFIGVIKELTETSYNCSDWNTIDLEVDVTTFKKVN